MATAPPPPPDPGPPSAGGLGAVPRTVATVGSRGADVVALATEATLRAAQVRAASIAASKAIAADRQQPSGS